MKLFWSDFTQSFNFCKQLLYTNSRNPMFSGIGFCFGLRQTWKLHGNSEIFCTWGHLYCVLIWQSRNAFKSATKNISFFEGMPFLFWFSSLFWNVDFNKVGMFHCLCCWLWTVFCQPSIFSHNLIALLRSKHHLLYLPLDLSNVLKLSLFSVNSKCYTKTISFV